MQIRGKIFTIIGIVLMFGYFIKDSMRSYESTEAIMLGDDTLGRDWGAMAEQIAQSRMQIQAENSTTESYDMETWQKNPYGGIDSNGTYTATTSLQQDPFARPKFNQDNYSTMESSDGREIITGYARPEEEDNRDTPENNERKIETRHHKEVGEPKMRYRE